MKRPFCNQRYLLLEFCIILRIKAVCAVAVRYMVILARHNPETTNNLQLRIPTIDAVFLRRRKVRATAFRNVFAIPIVVMELKRFRLRSRPDVDERLDFGSSEDDQVFFKASVAAGSELGIACFLQDPADPFFRIDDRIVSNYGPVDADESDRRHASSKRTSFDSNVFRFIGRVERPEELTARRAAEINASLCRLVE